MKRVLRFLMIAMISASLIPFAGCTGDDESDAPEGAGLETTSDPTKIESAAQLPTDEGAGGASATVGPGTGAPTP